MYRIFLKVLAGMAAMTMTLSQMPLLPSVAEEEGVPDFSLLGAVGSLSAEQTACVARSIYEGLSEHADRVRFDYNQMDRIAYTQENADALLDIYVTVVGGWDVGILAVKNHLNYSIGSYAGASCITSMGLLYLVEDAVYDNEYASLMKQLDTITAEVDPNWSAPEKALYLHEYLAIHYDYDYDALNASTSSNIPHSAYGILTNGKAVCEGYTWLYNLLLRRVGIESVAVVSTELNHTWNVLYIDGNWYHVDVTWDDNSNTHPGRVRHDSFLKNRDGMAESGHTSTDWVLTTGQSETLLPESDMYHNAFWTKSNAAIVFYQGTWLAVCPSESTPTDAFFVQYTFDAADGTAQSQTISSVSDKWMVVDKPGYFYAANYTIPSVNMGTLYYTTPASIMAYQNGRHIWICNLTEEQKQLGYIYGMYTQGDMLYYAVSEKGTADAEIFSISLTDYRDRIRDEAGELTGTTAPVPTTTASASAATTAPVPTTTASASSATTAPVPTTTASVSAATTAPVPTATASVSAVTTAPVPTTTASVSAVTTAPVPTTTASVSAATTAPVPATTTTASSTTTTVSETTTTASTTTTAPTETSTTESMTTVVTEPTEPIETDPTEPTEPETVPGDLDGDGFLTVRDVVVLNRYILGVLPPDELDLRNGDLVQDGIIDVFDLAMLKRALLEISS